MRSQILVLLIFFAISPIINELNQPEEKQAVLSIEGLVATEVGNLKCKFSLIYTDVSVDKSKSKVVCTKKKKPVSVSNYVLTSKDPLCVITLSMTIRKGKGTLKNAKIECQQTTPAAAPCSTTTGPPTPNPLLEEILKKVETLIEISQVTGAALPCSTTPSPASDPMLEKIFDKIETIEKSTNDVEKILEKVENIEKSRNDEIENWLIKFYLPTIQALVSKDTCPLYKYGISGLTGLDPNQSKSMRTWQQCLNFCKQTKGCTLWSFFPANTCFIGNQGVFMRQDQYEVYSGSVFCP